MLLNKHHIVIFSFCNTNLIGLFSMDCKDANAEITVYIIFYKVFIHTFLSQRQLIIPHKTTFAENTCTFNVILLLKTIRSWGKASSTTVLLLATKLCWSFFNSQLAWFECETQLHVLAVHAGETKSIPWHVYLDFSIPNVSCHNLYYCYSVFCLLSWKHHKHCNCPVRCLYRVFE